ncbi:MAG: hypothetical protein ABI361_14215 [Nitrososphaera sp.]
MSVSTGMNFRRLCDDILSLEGDLRFVCICSMQGRIVAIQYREDAIPLLVGERTQLWIMQALIRMSSRKTMEDSLGSPLFSLTEYEKVVKATILVRDAANKFGLGDEFVIVLSIRPQAQNPSAMLKETVIPYIKKLLNATQRPSCSIEGC